MEALNSK